MLAFLKKDPIFLGTLLIVLFFSSFTLLLTYFACKRALKQEWLSEKRFCTLSTVKQEQFRFFDTFMDLLPQYLLSFVLAIFLSAIFIVVPSLSTVVSCINHSDLPSIVLTAMLGVMGLLSICTITTRKYCAFVSTKEIFRANKVGRTTLNSVCCYLLYGFFCGVHVAYAGANTTTDVEVVYNLFYGCELFYFLATIQHTLNLLYTVFHILLSEDTKLLDDLYLAVHNDFRTRNEKLNKENRFSVDASINYLVSRIYSPEIREAYKDFENHKIRSVSFLGEEYSAISRYTKLYPFFSAVGLHLVLFIPFCGILFMIAKAPTLPALIGIGIYLLTNGLWVTIAFLKKGEMRKYYVRLAIGAWGFKMEKEKNTCYFSEHYCFGIRHRQGLKEQKCIRQIYCIVSLFLDVLDTDIDLAMHCLSTIEQYVQNQEFGYMLYMMCVYLFCRKNRNKADLFAEKLAGKFACNPSQKALFEHNISELAKDIFCNTESPTWIDIFNQRTTKENIRPTLAKHVASRFKPKHTRFSVKVKIDF